MKAASNLIMWLAMVLLVSLAMVLGLVLLLLGELYCPPLIRRNRHRHRQPTATGNENSDEHSQSRSHNSPNSPLDDIEKQPHHPPENQDSVANGCSILYISNPIYDGENGSGGGTVVAGDGDDKTPFETPETSPSRLETEDDKETLSSTPRLPMKRLPTVVHSVVRKDGGRRFLGSWGSDHTNSTINGVLSSSLSSTPCTTSPSL